MATSKICPLYDIPVHHSQWRDKRVGRQRQVPPLIGPGLLSVTCWLYVTRMAQYEVCVIVTIILVQAWTSL